MCLESRKTKIPKFPHLVCKGNNNNYDDIHFILSINVIVVVITTTILRVSTLRVRNIPDSALSKRNNR